MKKNGRIKRTLVQNNLTTDDGTETLLDFHDNQFVATKLETKAAGEHVLDPPVFTSGVSYNQGMPLRNEHAPTCSCAKLNELQQNIEKFECCMAAALQFHTDRTLRYQQQLVELTNQKGKRVEAGLKDIGHPFTNNMK
jgi:hypothetical protein